MTDGGALRIDKARGDEAALLAELNRQLDEDEPHPYPLPVPALMERMTRWIGEGEYQVSQVRSEPLDTECRAIERDGAASDGRGLIHGAARRAGAVLGLLGEQDDLLGASEPFG